MQFMIRGEKQTFIPLSAFREQFNLPDTFNLGYFEPKNYDGLASIEDTGALLEQLRSNLLAQIPDSLTLNQLIQLVDNLRDAFRDELYAINSQIRLKPEEVGFAVSGFSDVMRAFLYSLIPAMQGATPVPGFDVVYGRWLNDSIRVSVKVYVYSAVDDDWQVQIVNHAYGRVGLQVDTGRGRVYVMDGMHSCPAQGFMYGLLREIATKILVAI